jgi:hypothetical protein
MTRLARGGQCNGRNAGRSSDIYRLVKYIRRQGGKTSGVDTVKRFISTATAHIWLGGAELVHKLYIPNLITLISLTPNRIAGEGRTGAPRDSLYKVNEV